MASQPNPGHLPRECELRNEAGTITGYRPVHVRTFGGYDSQRAGHAPWPSAAGRPPTNWHISAPPAPFEIESYEVA